MNEDLQKTLVLAIVRLFIIMPMVVAGAAAFFARKRVKRSVLFSCLGILALFVPVSNICLRSFFKGAQYLWLDQILTLLIYLIIMAFFVLCYRLHPAQFVYVFCFLQLVSTLVNQFSYMVAGISAPPGSKISILSSPLYSGLMMGLTLLSAWFIYRFCKTMLLDAFETLESRSIWQLCILPVLFFIITQATHPVMIQFNGERAIIQLLLLLFIAAILTYATNLRAVMSSVHSARLRAESEETKKLLAMQERSYSQLLENIQQTQAARHDLRFHLSVIQELAEKGDMLTLTDYLADYAERLSPGEQKYCDNVAVDAVVRHFIQKARALGAACSCVVLLPPKAEIADVDLCVILGNLLENALHALESQGADGVLQLRCALRERRMLLTLDNTLPADFPGFRAGVGLQSVSAISARYNGSAKFEAVDGMFKASIILHLPHE